MTNLIPNSAGFDEGDRFTEMNTCHSPSDGTFCSGSKSGGNKQFGVETHTTVNGQRVGKTVGVIARSKDHAMQQARAAGHNVNAAYEAPQPFSKTKGPLEHLHRGFTIRQDGDRFVASHPKYPAARPTGATLGDVKTQINMFTAGTRNAASRARAKAMRQSRLDRGGVSGDKQRQRDFRMSRGRQTQRIIRMIRNRKD